VISSLYRQKENIARRFHGQKELPGLYGTDPATSFVREIFLQYFPFTNIMKKPRKKRRETCEAFIMGIIHRGGHTGSSGRGMSAAGRQKAE
jgi:hypothetical protein